jgi:hypothetical protein
VIKLEVEDYCQNCPNFEIYTDTRTTVGYANGIGQLSLTDHTIKCKHRELCIGIMIILKCTLWDQRREKQKMTINDGSISDGLIIGFDRAKNGDNTVLIVGRQQKDSNVKVVNVFAGDEAYELYKKLVEKREEENLNE